MNLELMARLNFDHLQELHGEAHRNRQARSALRLGIRSAMPALLAASTSAVLGRVDGTSRRCCAAA